MKDEKELECMTLMEANLRALCAEAIHLLSVFCFSEDEGGRDCPAWTDKCGQCALRDVEDWARELGVEWEA